MDAGAFGAAATIGTAEPPDPPLQAAIIGVNRPMAAAATTDRVAFEWG